MPDPNGLAFSPDYKRLYVASTGKGPGDTGPGGKGDMYVFDVGADNTLANAQRFADFMIDGVKCAPDGVRCDVRRQRLVLEQRRPRGRLQRRHGVDAAGQADRPHPSAGSLRQHLLRRAETQPAVHGREPVALRGLRQYAGGGDELKTGRTGTRGTDGYEEPEPGQLLIKQEPIASSLLAADVPVSTPGWETYIASMRLLHLLALLGAIAASGPSGGAQSPAPPAGLIAGHVINSATGRPAAGVVVRLEEIQDRRSLSGETVSIVIDAPTAARLGLNPPQQVLTAEDGAFLFAGLRAGTLFISVAHAAYARHGSDSIYLRDGEPRTGLTIALDPLASIEGSASDERGDPMAGLEVRAMRRTALGGRYRFATVASAKTDDRGVYHFASLMPGDYLVAVPSTTVTIPSSAPGAGGAAGDTPRPATLVSSGAVEAGPNAVRFGSFLVDWKGPVGSVTPASTADMPVSLNVYPAAFYPLASAPDTAVALTLTPGTASQGVNFEMRPVRATSIAGVVRAPDGSPARIGLWLIRRGMDAATPERGFESAFTTSDPHRRLHVPRHRAGRVHDQGASRSQCLAASPEQPRMAGDADCGRLRHRPRSSVGGQRTRVMGGPAGRRRNTTADWRACRIASGPSQRGRIMFDGTRTDAVDQIVQRVQVLLTPLDKPPVSGVPPGTHDSDGRFATAAVPPGRYAVALGVPNPRWFIKGVMVDGRDVFESSIELTTADVDDAVVVLSDRRQAVWNNQRGRRPGGRATSVTLFFMPADVDAWIASGMNRRGAQSTELTPAGTFAFGSLRPAATWSSRSRPRNGRTCRTPTSSAPSQGLARWSRFAKATTGSTGWRSSARRADIRPWRIDERHHKAHDVHKQARAGPGYVRSPR